MKKLYYFLSLVLMFIVTSVYATVYDSIIVKAKDNEFKTKEELKTYLSKFLPDNLEFNKELPNHAAVFKVLHNNLKEMSEDDELKYNSDLESRLSKIESDNKVAYAEVNKKLYILKVPTDNRYFEQWQYFDSHGGINLEKAWDITTGSSDVVVAILDTGIVRHDEYMNKVVHGRNFIEGEDKDNYYDKGIYVPQYGYRIYHGSHVAGTVAANACNGNVVGVSWGAKILPVKVLSDDGSGSLSGIIEGMLWAAGLGSEENNNPANVLNLSLGGWGYCSKAMQDTIDQIVANNVSVVVAAGNNNYPADFFTPASCNKVITVAASNKRGEKAAYSNWGFKVDIVAPGGETSYSGDMNGILSTHGVNDFYYMQGTSMASPHVAGAIALILSVNPDLNPDQIKEIIKLSARGNLLGVGILDVYQALKLANPQDLTWYGF